MPRAWFCNSCSFTGKNHVIDVEVEVKKELPQLLGSNLSALVGVISGGERGEQKSGLDSREQGLASITTSRISLDTHSSKILVSSSGISGELVSDIIPSQGVTAPK